MRNKIVKLGTFAFLWVLFLYTSATLAQPQSDPTDIIPDLRDYEMRLKVQKGDFVAVPIPTLNPTLDAGLVLAGAYFYPQSEEQEKVQPASVTAVAGMYTSNDSKAYAIAQRNYWHQDTWRFGGAIGHADLKLTLLSPNGSGTGQSTSWLIRGNLLQAQLSRKVGGKWYLGFSGRFVDVDQELELDSGSIYFDNIADVKSVGIGANIEYDSRDMPFNTYAGRLFQVKTLFNDQSLGSDETYQSYGLAYRSYHEMSIPMVLAWEVKGCLKVGTVPLWDACKIGLRGFSVTDYLGKSSVSAQFEARWRMSKKWGLVGFGGAGFIAETFSRVRERELIPSYGIGLRYTVLAAKRINVRLDYARSTDSDAIYLSVGEAF
jgi:hypothetical protein